MTDPSATAGYTGLLKRLWWHLGAKRRRQVLFIVALMLVAALAEVVSLGAVLPFVGVLAASRISCGSTNRCPARRAPWASIPRRP